MLENEIIEGGEFCDHDGDTL